MEFTYTAEDLTEKPSSYIFDNCCVTEFDRLLSTEWNKAVKNGLFKYTLEDCQYKVLKKDSFQFVAQLNPQRGFNRRKRGVYESMNAAFCHEQFNFTKMNSKEILCTLKPGNNTASVKYDSNVAAKNDHTVAVNISPIDDCHILFVPQLHECLPQKITLSSLLLAFDLAQLSGNPGFRVGFNSLHAWASVNHLHYHAMYLDRPLFIDNHPASTLVKSNCYLMDDSPIPGFVFKIPSTVDERIKVASEVASIVDILHEEGIPYNAVLTRGVDAGTRLVLFPRKSTKDLFPSPCFDVACVEVGGQFPIKTEEEFNNLTFEKALQILGKATLNKERFTRVLEIVKRVL